MAQNLVPNTSFEQNSNCPNLDGQINYSDGWDGYSADYFNSCDNSNYVSVPYNFFGYNTASNGIAYSGIYCYNSNLSNYREFLQHQLQSPLSIGIKYFVSIKVNLANLSTCATNNLGIYFRTIPLSVSSPPTINNNPSIISSSVILDSANWTILTGTVVADSSYNYIIIGNSLSDSLVDIVGNSSCSSYYYIDEVCVSADSTECDLGTFIVNPISESEITAVPNPASNIIYFNNSNEKKFQFSLVNYLGQEVMRSQEKNLTKINVSLLPQGIYFLKIISTSKTSIQTQLIIH